VPITAAAAPVDDALRPAGARVNGHPVHQPMPERPRGPTRGLPRIDPALLTARPKPARPRVSKAGDHDRAFVLVCIVALGYAVTHRAGITPRLAPTILAPRRPYVGIPTSLADVVRIEAESTATPRCRLIISAVSSSAAPLIDRATRGDCSPGTSGCPATRRRRRTPRSRCRAAPAST
jgi:hypothetical protein